MLAAQMVELMNMGMPQRTTGAGVEVVSRTARSSQIADGALSRLGRLLGLGSGRAPAASAVRGPIRPTEGTHAA